VIDIRDAGYRIPQWWAPTLTPCPLLNADAVLERDIELHLQLWSSSHSNAV
jgi:hypothetical protein